MSRFKIVAAAVVAVAVGFAPSVVAQGKRKGQAAAAIGFSVVVVSDQNQNELPNFGDQISFNVTSTETSDPHVQLVCTQNGAVVYGGLWPLTPVLTLSSLSWTSGAADCTATVYYIVAAKKINIGSVNFTVAE